MTFQEVIEVGLPYKRKIWGEHMWMLGRKSELIDRPGTFVTFLLEDIKANDWEIKK